MKVKTKYDAKAIFGGAGPVYLDITNKVVSSLKSVTQRIEDNSEFQKLLMADTAAGNKIYLEELLFRLYVVAVGSIRRNQQWFDASLNAPNDCSLFASLRSLLESVTDSYHSLQGAPLGLASNYQLISETLQGRTDHGILCCEELENFAIHFTHARSVKKGEGKTMDPCHKAKGATQYINTLDIGEKIGFKTLYADLCELVHPAADSMHDYMSWNRPTREWTIHQQSGRALPLIMEKHENALHSLLAYAFNPAFILLKVLNTLPYSKLHTPACNHISLSSMKLWRDCESAIAIGKNN
jgi:hypothetical protein